MALADELCDRVAFIVDGRIELIDTPRRLKLRYGERRVRIEHAGPDGVERSEFPLEGLGDNPEFLGILRRREIETIHTLEATLDDIFVRVTGRKLV
jgi:fluoroquinolone transport system ATP-binding protein